MELRELLESQNDCHSSQFKARICRGPRSPGNVLTPPRALVHVRATAILTFTGITYIALFSLLLSSLICPKIYVPPPHPTLLLPVCLLKNAAVCPAAFPRDEVLPLLTARAPTLCPPWALIRSSIAFGSDSFGKTTGSSTPSHQDALPVSFSLLFDKNSF